MSEQPTADTLMRQAPQTAALYLRDAVESIDGMFGEGYAKANPPLVAAFLAACSADFSACMVSNAISSLGDCVYAGLSSRG